jgi:biopolymer transport protein ExbD
MASRFRRVHRQPPELDITAFMNLMVILVPFLLITAVFNQINILEMNLPEKKEEPPAQVKPPEFALEIVLRKNKLQVNDKPGRLLKTIPMAGEDYDLAALTKLLQQLKARYPDETAATLLMEPEVTYEHLINIMDTVRLVEKTEDGKTTQYELFPDIALGDAPAVKGSK